MAQEVTAADIAQHTGEADSRLLGEPAEMEGHPESPIWLADAKTRFVIGSILVACALARFALQMVSDLLDARTPKNSSLSLFEQVRLEPKE